MKRIISTFISAIIGITALSSLQAGAVEQTETSEKKSMVILGDSIASGFTRNGNVAHNYGEICGDYLGCDVYNYAAVGDNSDEMLDKMASFGAAETKAITDAEYVVISVGGNDIMEYISKYMLVYASRNNFLNEGYTTNDIPAKPSITDMTKMLNIYGEGGLKEYMSTFRGLIAFGQEISDLVAEIAGIPDLDTDIYSGGYIKEHIVPNIQKAVSDIKKVNPDSKVYVQTIFQPLQFDKSFLDQKYADKKDTVSAINVLRFQLENIMQSYSDQLKTVKNIDIVDVRSQFTALTRTPSADNQGYSHYFVDVQTAKTTDLDVHPNQRGHVAIAAAVLDKIGDLHTDNGLLTRTFNSLSDKESYPAIPLETYERVSGHSGDETKLGDINGDSFVDAVDASGVLREYARNSVGKGTFTDAQKKLADVDTNGIIDSVDASKILKYYAYLSKTESEKKTLEEFLKTA